MGQQCRPELIMQRVPFTSGLVLVLALVIFGTSFVALEDMNWAMAAGNGGYHVGLRRARTGASTPIPLAELCGEEAAGLHDHSGPWCTCARLGRSVQWMLYTTCTFALLAGGLAVASDTHAGRARRAHRSPGQRGRAALRLSSPVLVGTILCWVAAWFLLMLSLLMYGTLAPDHLVSSTTGEQLPLELSGVYVWLRHSLAVASLIAAAILAALFGIWSEKDLVHAVVTVMRSSRVGKMLYALIGCQLLLIALVPVRGLGTEAILCAAGLYALHEQATRPKLLAWYGALLSCLTVIACVDVIKASHNLTETLTQDAQLALKVCVLLLLALELWPGAPDGRLHTLRQRDTFNASETPRSREGAPCAGADEGKSGSGPATHRNGPRSGLGSELPPWVFKLGWFLWDTSYFVTSLVDIISDMLVIWQWGVLGYRGHFRLGVAIFVSTNVWYTLLFLLLLFASAAAPPPPQPPIRAAGRARSSESDGQGAEPEAEPYARQLARVVARWMGESRLSAAILFLALLPFGQVYPFLVYGMLRLAPPELIRFYAVAMLGGPAARLLADDDFFDWFIDLLPYAPFLVETLCEAVPMSLVQLSAIVSIEHQDDVGLLQLGSIAISVSVIVTRAVMLAFSFSPHVTFFKAFCLAADVLLTFYTIAALFGTAHVYDARTAPHEWFVWFWEHMPSVSPLGAVWCWIWLCVLGWLLLAALGCLLAYEWHAWHAFPEQRAFSLASRVLVAEPAAGVPDAAPAEAAPSERPFATAAGHAVLRVAEELVLGLALLTLAVGPAFVLLGTLTFSWLVLGVMVIEPEYGGATQPWARRAVSDFVASDLAAKALVRLATVDGLAQCALSGWWPGQLADAERAEQVARAAQLARSPAFDLDLLNDALDVSSKWALFLAATSARFYESLLSPIEAKFGPCTRALLRAYSAFGVLLYTLAKAYTLLFPFLSFFLEQTVSGAISQVTFVAMLCCLLGMLLLRHSYERYILVCSVYSGLLLDLPAILADRFADLAHLPVHPAAAAAHGARKARLTGASAALHEATLLSHGGEGAAAHADVAAGAQAQPGGAKAKGSVAFATASPRGAGEGEGAGAAPFLLREDAPLAAFDSVPRVQTAEGGELLSSLFVPTANGEKVLERLRQRALTEVFRASLYDQALKYAKGGRGSPSEGSSESADDRVDDGAADEEGEAAHASARRGVPTERQVALALVRELDALYRHMRERDADVLVRVGVERLCMCLFRLSGGVAERVSMRDEDAWWDRKSLEPNSSTDGPDGFNSRLPMFDMNAPAVGRRSSAVEAAKPQPQSPTAEPSRAAKHDVSPASFEC